MNKGGKVVQSSSVLKSARTGKNDELKSYKKRKGQLDSIISKFNTSFGDYVDDINTYENNINVCLNDGMKGNASCRISFTSESNSFDADLSDSRTYILTELDRVVDKIATLESEIAQLNFDIRSAEVAERAEKEAAKNR